MKKFEKYSKYVPMIYAIYMPINFFIHIIGVYSGCIRPFFTNVLDLIRVLVIAAFAFYLVEGYGYSTYWEKSPSMRMITFAGIAFLEWVYNVATSNMYLEYYDHTVFFVAFWVLFLAGYLYETIAIEKIAKLYDGGSVTGWLTVNVWLVMSVVVSYYFRNEWNGKHFFVTLFFVALRAVVREELIRWLASGKPTIEQKASEAE